MARRAVDLLIRQGASILLHLGDVGSVEVIDALVVPPPMSGDAAQRIESHVVFGNTDHDWQSLARYARELGVIVDHPVGWLKVGGADLVFLHGDDPAAMSQALARGVEYLCFGHTHHPQDSRAGATRLINPGALFRARPRTVALLDAASRQLTFHPVEEDGRG
jgi:uncharacterized protein